jgi:biofilm PGA synthesis N-glycosyltransferase PgaC
MDAIIYIILVANLVSMLHLGMFISGANAYDIQAIRNRRLEAVRAKRRRKPASGPLVSVVVPAHNEEQGIVRTLDSLLRSNYRNMEIIVVDDGSTDRTSDVVRGYVARIPVSRSMTYMARSGRDGSFTRRIMRATHKSIPIKLVRQVNGGKGSAMNNGIKNHARGSLVMCLDADSMIQPNAIANAVKHFQDKRVIGLAANVRVMGKGWIGTLQRFEHMIGYRSKKFYTMTNSEFIVGGVASTYRKSVLKQVGFYDTDTQTEDIGLSMKIVAQLGNKDKRIIYASDVVAMTEGVGTYRALIKQRYRWKLGSLQNLYKYRKMMGKVGGKTHSWTLTLYRLPVAVLGELLLVLEPLMMTYIVYLSISRQSVGIFLGAYVTITLYTLWTIWPDEHMSVKQKLRMSVSAFVIYLLFYAMTLVQLLAIFRCLINYRKIYDLSGQKNTWVSPARASSVPAAV